MILESPDLIRLDSIDGIRKSAKWLFIIMVLIEVFILVLAGIANDNFVHFILHGDLRWFTVGFTVFNTLLLFLWWIAPRKEILIDRKNRIVTIRTKKIEHQLPWKQIVPSTHWELGNTRAMEWMQLYARPPFPEALARAFEKKGRPPAGLERGAIIGSVWINSPEHGEAIFRFLDAWMNSQEPAWPLYQTIVRTPFGD